MQGEQLFDRRGSLRTGEFVRFLRRLIGGNVTGYVDPSSPNYSGQWPANTNWMSLSGNVVAGGLSVVPAGAKNTSTHILKTFNGSAGWTAVSVPTSFCSHRSAPARP